MRILSPRAVLAVTAACALAGSQLAMSISTRATAPPATPHATTHHSAAPAHPVAYVPLRGSKQAPFDQVFTNMDYNGGPVMPSNTDYMVLWSPSGLSAY